MCACVPPVGLLNSPAGNVRSFSIAPVTHESFLSQDPLIVFSSNMFAILGLRSLYPVLSSAVNDLKYLEPAVAVILAFIGGKMIAEYFGYGLPTEVALAMIVSFLGIGVGASMWEKDHQQKRERDS